MSPLICTTLLFVIARKSFKLFAETFTCIMIMYRAFCNTGKRIEIVFVNIVVVVVVVVVVPRAFYVNRALPGSA